jgi:plastocyanin
MPSRLPIACLVLLAWLSSPGVVFSQSVEVSGSIVLETERTRPDDETGYSDAVVWLTPVGSPSSGIGPTAGHFEITQKDKRFLPRILPVPVGSTVDFPNLDPFFHNVFSLFEGKRFDLGLYEAGTSQSALFDRQGISYIFCNIHPDMVAVIVAVETDLFGLTDARGRFQIEDVPPGDYQLRVWHERMETKGGAEAFQAVSVEATDVTIPPVRMVDSSLALENHTNKFGQEYESPATGTPYLLPR